MCYGVLYSSVLVNKEKGLNGIIVFVHYALYIRYIFSYYFMLYSFVSYYVIFFNYGKLSRIISLLVIPCLISMRSILIYYVLLYSSVIVNKCQGSCSIIIISYAFIRDIYYTM